MVAKELEERKGNGSDRIKRKLAGVGFEIVAVANPNGKIMESGLCGCI